MRHSNAVIGKLVSQYFPAWFSLDYSEQQPNHPSRNIHRLRKCRIVPPLSPNLVKCSTRKSVHNHGNVSFTVYKKLSCRGETARCFVSLNTALSHSRSLKVIGNGTIRKLGYGFLFAFHSNYGSNMYRFRDKAIYWSKIANILRLHSPCYA